MRRIRVIRTRSGQSIRGGEHEFYDGGDHVGIIDSRAGFERKFYKRDIVEDITGRSYNDEVSKLIIVTFLFILILAMTID